MTTITRTGLAEAAQHGYGIDHLTPGQAWAANSMELSPEHLEHPLKDAIADLLANIEHAARRRFYSRVAPHEPESVIRLAYDEDHPMFLRAPILEKMSEGKERIYSSMKPAGINEEGFPSYRLADLAQVLGTSEEVLMDHAKALGITTQHRTTPLQPLH
ncbi:hypothetical protein RSO41_14135 [Halomonas sp. I1]|uniref:hypothetical protein n=1 Tax=Halomonas sp. I1 TaxID=393536 RepID=UPI0028DECBC8|nr:hypothetical protein [Halomonas sp. I1]MDT8895793.1 hypothetical protein [Halomonas sp. I1]